MSRTQKAVLVKEVGKPVELGTRHIPSPKEGQVLLKVTATMRMHNSPLPFFLERRQPCV